jgi:hypothetical protein
VALTKAGELAGLVPIAAVEDRSDAAAEGEEGAAAKPAPDE